MVTSGSQLKCKTKFICFSVNKVGHQRFIYNAIDNLSNRFLSLLDHYWNSSLWFLFHLNQIAYFGSPFPSLQKNRYFRIWKLQQRKLYANDSIDYSHHSIERTKLIIWAIKYFKELITLTIILTPSFHGRDLL